MPLKMKYHKNNNGDKTFVFFNKTDNYNFYNFFSEPRKKYYLGIYMQKNNKINEKIDKFQGAFLKKKLEFFKKNIIHEKDLNDGFYLDFVLLKDKVFYDHLFDFLFDDFFFENIFLINSNNIESDFANIKNIIDLECVLSSSINIINFGYTNGGEKVLTINSANSKNNYLEKIEVDKIKSILENTVIFHADTGTLGNMRM